MEKGATLSECGTYRYQLWRIWDKSKPLCLFVMHNPSTADADEDDPTIRRCIGFAKSWGYGGIYVGNLSPFRATNPKDMLSRTKMELCPLLNNSFLKEMRRKCSMHVLAYGNPITKTIAPRRFRDQWYCLKTTKAGNPCHPLYLKSDLKPIPFIPLTH